MNVGFKFTPSSELRKQSASAEPVAEIATKTASVDAELSEEELAFVRSLVANKDAELAKLLINGTLVRIGTQWLPGGQELWERQ